MKIPQLPTDFEFETEVQFHYSSVICKILECRFSVKFGTDGIYHNKIKNIKVLAEFKVGENLKEDKEFFVKCVIQILCYIKKIEDSGESLPNIIFIGNDNHFAIFDSSILSEYLEFVNSIMVPSDMFLDPPEKLKTILLEKLNVHKYPISHLSMLKTIINNYEDKSVGLKMTINNNNITRIFEDFITTNVLNQKISENEQVALFASIIFDECNDIVGKPNQIVTPLSNKKVVKINRDNYDAFLLSIKAINKPSSKTEIIAQSDRLIEEVSRRFHGEFYTPEIWVNEAHKMIELHFGQNWKDEYVVWDPACGTGNLTRDYQFKELYCSTLYQSDIDIMNQRSYNPEAVKFQYDFLNDDVYPEGIDGVEEDKLKKFAPGLVKAFEENSSIIIFMNPPYHQGGTAYEGSIGKKKTKPETQVLMNGKKLGHAAKQLYLNFLFRILMLKQKYNHTNINIVFYSNGLLFSVPSYEKFRELLFIHFKFYDGFMMPLESFSNTGTGSVFLSILKSEKSVNSNSFDFHNKIKNQNQLFTIYNLDGELDIRDLTKINRMSKTVPTVSIRYKKGEVLLIQEDKTIEGLIYHFGYDGTAIWTKYYCGISNLSFGKGCISFDINSFYKGMESYTARMASPLDRYTAVFELAYPNTSHSEYKQWSYDCIIYSIFQDRCRCFSLRNFNNKNLNVINELFWFPKQLLQQLADDNGFDELYQDATIFNQERFVYQELQKVQLSPDAKAVLDKATELVIKSIGERKRLHQLHPEWHLNAWDAGWYQIKLILKDCMKDDLAEFTALYKEFENRMREGVYKFGFLK